MGIFRVLVRALVAMAQNYSLLSIFHTNLRLPCLSRLLITGDSPRSVAHPLVPGGNILYVPPTYISVHFIAYLRFLIVFSHASLFVCRFFGSFFTPSQGAPLPLQIYIAPTTKFHGLQALHVYCAYDRLIDLQSVHVGLSMSMLNYSTNSVSFNLVSIVCSTRVPPSVHWSIRVGLFRSVGVPALPEHTLRSAPSHTSSRPLSTLRSSDTSVRYALPQPLPLSHSRGKLRKSYP